MTNQLSKRVREQVWRKTLGHCWYCGRPTMRITGRWDRKDRRAQARFMEWWFTVDHIVPQSDGGSDELHNLVPACRRCNLKKRSMSINEFGDATYG